jgi:hypothetical protein
MKKQLPPEESPSTWLWQEITRRYGHEAATSLRAGYAAKLRQYDLRKRIERFQREIDFFKGEIAKAKPGVDDKDIRGYQRQLAHRQAVLAAVEQDFTASDVTEDTIHHAFLPGQSVVWLSRKLGIYGSHLVDGRKVTPQPAEVMQTSAKQVQIRLKTDAGKLVWVPATSLREQATWDAMVATGGVQAAYV